MSEIVRSDPGTYSGELGRVDRELRRALRALDGAADDLRSLDLCADDLPALQYALHVAAERVLDLRPEPGFEEAHAELGIALAIAREETADVAEALGTLGEEAAADLLWEWRAALFGVRLALRRLDRCVSTPQGRPRPSFAPVLLLLLGVAAVLGGALVDLWPVWAVGLVVVGASAGLSRRHP